jgi:cytochrome c556
MPTRHLFAAAAALLLVAAAPPALAPEQYVAARQASYDMSVIVFGSLQTTAKSGGDVSKAAYTATGLARWAKVLPTLFPAGSGEGSVKVFTQAKPVIWTDRAGFDAAAANYAAQTDKLVQLAKAGDADGFKSQVGEVSKACDACHAKYKDGPQK